MDANELATIAIDAMPLEVLAPADKGQVWGVLQMALRTLEAQHESLLAEADNEAAEAAEARKLLAEATQQRDDLHKRVSFLNFENSVHGAPVILRQELIQLQAKFDAMTQERDNALRSNSALVSENARLHRSLEERMSVLIPGAVKVADSPQRIHYAAAQSGQLEP